MRPHPIISRGSSRLLGSQESRERLLRFVTPIVSFASKALELSESRPGQTNFIRAGLQLEQTLAAYSARVQHSFKQLGWLYKDIADDISQAIGDVARGNRPTLFVDGSESSVRALIWLERNNIQVNEYHLRKPLSESIVLGEKGQDTGVYYYIVEGVPIQPDLYQLMEWPTDSCVAGSWGIDERIEKIRNGDISSPLLVLDAASGFRSASDMLARSEAMVVFGFDPQVYAAVFGVTPHDEVRIAARDPSPPQDWPVQRGKDCNPLADAIVRYISDSDADHGVLDFGCGDGMDVEYFRAKMIDAQGYDPFHPDYCKESVLDAQYDIVMLRRVLNTIPEHLGRERVLEQIRALNPSLLFVQVPGPDEERRWKRMRGQAHNDGFAILGDPKLEPWPLWSFQRSFTREQLDKLLDRHGFVPMPNLLEMLDAGERHYKLSALGYGSVVGVYKPR